ncbi:MAG TPA: phosphotransferase [bacterium]|nr:phosphotransferase [bacterium]
MIIKPPVPEKQSIQEIAKIFLGEEKILEIKDISFKQGWSTKYLFEIYTEEKTLKPSTEITNKTNVKGYILKGKTKEQRKGFMESMRLMEFLLKKGFLVRTPIKTIKGKNYSHKIKIIEESAQTEEIYWSMTSFIGGIDSDVTKFSPNTASQLGEKVAEYISFTKNKKIFSKIMGISSPKQEERLTFIRRVHRHKDFLKKMLPKEFEAFMFWEQENEPKLEWFFKSREPKAILHGDLNQKNILTSQDGKEIIAIIDWDHCKYDYILTDITTPINLFFEYTSCEHAEKLKKAYLEKILAKFPTKAETIRLVGEYQASKNKWESILFYTGLIEELGDSTGELKQFTDNVKGEGEKWSKIMQCWEIA